MTISRAFIARTKLDLTCIGHPGSNCSSFYLYMANNVGFSSTPCHAHTWLLKRVWLMYVNVRTMHYVNKIAGASKKVSMQFHLNPPDNGDHSHDFHCQQSSITTHVYQIGNLQTDKNLLSVASLMFTICGGLNLYQRGLQRGRGGYEVPV